MKMTDKLRGSVTGLLCAALVALSFLFGPAPNARADYGSDAHSIFGSVTYDNATYDAALPQLEALVDQAGTNLSNLDGIMRGMYYFISPSDQGGSIPNRIKLARIIESRIIAKFADMTKYSGTPTDAIWKNADASSVLTYQTRAIDSSTSYLEMDGLRLLWVSTSSPNYLVSDEDLGLGRCAWSTSNTCQQTIPGSIQTMRATASTQPTDVRVGQTLTPQPTFTTTPWRVMYKWQRDSDTGSTVVQLSTSPSYTVQQADDGALLSCFVYFSKAGFMMDPNANVEDGSWVYMQVGSAVPPPVDKVFSRTYSPTISGTTKVGKTLTASVKKWSPSASLKYQWMRNGTAIEGATSRTYRLVAADLSNVMSVSVTGSRTGYTSVTKSSAMTKVVTPGSITRGKVKVSGTRRVGRVLSASTSHWTSGVSFAYQWYRNGVFMEGATGKSITLAPTDRGSRFKVVVAATKDGYLPATPKSSARTAKIKTGYLTKGLPTISGNTVVDETLTVNPGTWKPAETTFTYQWYKVNRKGKSYRISGATQASYTIASSLKGWRLKVRVTGRAIGYYTSSRYSARTGYVTENPYVPAPPTASPTPTPAPTGTP